jgi:hypothetical protein
MIDKEYRRQAARILRIMLDTPEPLHPLILSFLENNNEEIYQYSYESFNYNALNLRGRYMEQRLRSRFGGLIEISAKPNGNWTESRALFFHQTVREYFQQPAPWKILLEDIPLPRCDKSQMWIPEIYLHCCRTAWKKTHSALKK